MARNEEKHSGRLNRLWLQHLDEEHSKKNPARPGLGSLVKAQDVKKWMPSIKKDIDFYLKQSQVGCYPERKIAEFSEKIDSLTREYKAYLRKYRELEGSCSSSIPWADAPYSRKHKTTKGPRANNDADLQLTKKLRSSVKPESSETSSFSPLSVPILDVEDSYKDFYGYSIVNPEQPAALDSDIISQDLPLEFNWNKNRKALKYDDQDRSDSFDIEMEPKVFNFQRKTNSISCRQKCSDKSDGDLEHLKFDNCLELINDNVSEDNAIMSGSTLDSFNKKQVPIKLNKQCPFGKVETVKNNAVVYFHGEQKSKDDDSDNEAGNILNLPYSDSSSDEVT